MVSISGGNIVLVDEGSRRHWTQPVAPYFLSSISVTRGLYHAIMDPDGKPPNHPRLPQTDVSWLDAVRFCNQLSAAAGLTPCYSGDIDSDGTGVVCDFEANGYRLPTEAEWEYGCRAGSNDNRYGPLDDIAWHGGNSTDAAQEVGLKRPNAWGLFDTLGNVWEWCWDVYDPEVYGPYRVLRGGGFSDLPRACRASCRRKSHPTFAIDDLGFRLARTAL